MTRLSALTRSIWDYLRNFSLHADTLYGPMRGTRRMSADGHLAVACS